MSRFCPKCGFENTDAGKFCAKCGTTLKEPSGQQVKQPEQQPGGYTPPVTQPPQAPKTSNKMVLGLAIIAIILSAVALSSAFLITPETTIDANSVGQDELKDNSVTSNKVADKTIKDDDISDTGISKIKYDTISSNHIIDNSITFQDLASDVYTKIFNQTIVSEDIANDSITSDKIKNLTIVTNDLANDSVNTEKIKDGEVKNADIATDAVRSAEIKDGEVKTSDIDSNAVTYDKMAIKIKSGIAENVKHGDTINHGLDLGYPPTSVVVTPVYDYTYEYIPGELGNAVIHANVNNVTDTTFGIALWIEIEYNFGMPNFLQKVDGSGDYPSQDVYWIAIYDPNA